MQPDQEMGPAMQLRVEFSRREKGRKKSDGQLAQAIRSQRRGNRNSQIKWELQQYPTYPELLENRSSKLMLFFFSTTESKCFFPKMETSKSAFIIVPCCNGVVSRGHMQGHFPWQ